MFFLLYAAMIDLFKSHLKRSKIYIWMGDFNYFYWVIGIRLPSSTFSKLDIFIKKIYYKIKLIYILKLKDWIFQIKK